MERAFTGKPECAEELFRGAESGVPHHSSRFYNRMRFPDGERVFSAGLQETSGVSRMVAHLLGGHIPTDKPDKKTVGINFESLLEN